MQHHAAFTSTFYGDDMWFSFILSLAGNPHIHLVATTGRKD
jgi:hypothetical protein